MRVVERTPALSPALKGALDDVVRFGQAPAYRRREIERTVEALLTVLDHMDGDPDLEPEEDRGELDHLPDAVSSNAQGVSHA